MDSLDGCVPCDYSWVSMGLDSIVYLLVILLIVKIYKLIRS